MSFRTTINQKGHLICGVAARCMRASRRCWMPSQPSRSPETSRCCGRAGAPTRSTEAATHMCPLAPRLQMWRPCLGRWWGLPHPDAHGVAWLAGTKAGPSQVPQVSVGQVCMQMASFHIRMPALHAVVPMCCSCCSSGVQRCRWHDAPSCSVCRGGHACASHWNSAWRLLRWGAGGPEIDEVFSREEQCCGPCSMMRAALRLRLRPESGVHPA